MMGRSHLLLPTWPFVLAKGLLLTLLLGALGWVGFHWMQGMVGSAQRLIAAGWDRLVGLSEPFPFAVRCQFFPECARAYAAGFEQSVGETYSALTVVPLALLGLLIVTVIEARKPRKLGGTARLATTRDLAGLFGVGLAGYYGMFRAGWGWRMLQLPTTNRLEHSLVTGAPGTGKTEGYFKPNLLKDAAQGYSAILYDYKYPAMQGGLAAVPSWFSVLGRPVWLYRPFDMDSARVNLMAGGENRYQAKAIATMLIPQDERVSDGTVYRNLARTLLTGLIMAVVREGRPSFGYLAAISGAGTEAVQAFVEERPYLRQLGLGAVLGAAPKMFSGAVDTVSQALDIFRHPAVDRATSVGTGEMLDLARVFQTPSLLYIGIPESEIQSEGDGQILLQVIKRAIDAAIQAAKEGNGGSTVPVQTNVYLDEWPNFGRLPGIIRNLATHRSQGVAYHCGMQNLAQGRLVYGQDLFDAIKGTNFANLLALPSGAKFEEAETWSALLDETTVVESSKTYSKDSPLEVTGRRSHAQREAVRRLLTRDQLRRFERGSGILLLPERFPAVVRMPRLDEPGHALHSLYQKVRPLERPIARQPATPTDEEAMFAAYRPFIEALERKARQKTAKPELEADALEAATQALRDFVQQAVNGGVKFKSYRRSKTLTRVDFFTPPEPKWLEVWTGQGWVQPLPDGLAIKFKALAFLSDLLAGLERGKP